MTLLLVFRAPRDSDSLLEEEDSETWTGLGPPSWGFRLGGKEEKNGLMKLWLIFCVGLS